MALENVADEELSVLARLTVSLLVGMTPPPPIPIEDLPSSILVRGFMSGVDWDRWEDAESTLAEDVVVVTWDGSERVGRAAVMAWFRAEFGRTGCSFIRRTDAGHLNDNSIVYGQDNGTKVEYRPILCFRPDALRRGRRMERSAIRFVTPRNGRIARIEALPHGDLK